MKKYIEMILRKIGVSMLALLMVMTTYFSNSGGSLFLKTKKVQADTGETTLAMSQAMSSNKIPAIGRAASEGLWAMTAGGHRVFCLNSGKTMCSGDTLKYKTVNAATYEKKGIAKALNWYFRSSRHISGLADMEQTNRIPCIKLERMSRKDIHRAMQRSSVKRSVIRIRREQSIITRSRNV